jgi:HK97 family phage portal protein
MVGLIDSIMRPRASITKDNITTSKELYNALFTGGDSATGIAVSPESAIRYTTVLACVRVLAESVASLPCILYRRRADGGKDRATDHPLYSVLHDQSNAWNTSYEYFEGQMTNLALRGNGYALPERNRRGQTIGLIPLNPDPVVIDQAKDWTPLYTVTLPDNTRAKFNSKELHHVRGPMPLGYVGRSIISLARDAVGLGLAAEQFGSHLYKNGVKPSGVLKHPKTLGPEATENLRQQFQDKYGGLSNSSKPLVLEEAMEWVPLSIAPNDAQFLETRKFQRSEIAGIFRVPAHMIGDLERSTNNNIEHQSLEFVMHTLRPWLKRIEQAINRDLLADTERDEYFAEFLIDDLLRGDIKTRYAAYAIAIQNKIMNANEVRAIENRNPREGGEVYENPAIQVDAPADEADAPQDGNRNGPD